MALALIALLTHDARQMQIRRRQDKPHLLPGLPDRTGMRGFPHPGLELPATGAPETKVRLLRPLQEENLPLRIEAVKEGGNFVWEGHYFVPKPGPGMQ